MAENSAIDMTFISRLEAATKSDRGLDHDIAVTLFPDKFRPSDHGGNRMSGHCVGLDEDGTPCCTAEVPPYTASIDAALTLVPEGWSISHAYWGRLPRAHLTLTRVKRGDDGMGVFRDGDAATPAIALCIAALRARGIA